MYRRLFKFVVTTLTILTANLITNYASEYLIGYKRHMRPLAFTLVAMGIITLIFYPLFTKMEEWLTELSARIVKSGRSMGGKYLGLLLVFALSLCILTYFYTKLWYRIDLIKSLINGSILNLW
jgi:hypothetical protein